MTILLMLAGAWALLAVVLLMDTGRLTRTGDPATFDLDEDPDE